ncbi:MAG TPA: proline dehydrogenase family protein [Candidatus Eisenbacteria bacterium]|nr:proline dehydrogenase family protein [Candidatus Eisenbacteria bacterium]
MSAARSFITWLSNQRAVTRAIAGTGMRLGFARRFIAGETLEDALRAAAELNAKGMLVILNQLGEHVTDRASAEASFASYERMLREISARKLDAGVTVKPTQLGLSLDPALCLELTKRLVADAASRGNFLEIDMEDSPTVDATLALFEGIRRDHENVGLAVQAYLFRTEADLRRLQPLRPKIRLVKGAYLEPHDVAFASKHDVDANFVKLMRILFTDGFFPAVGSHDEAMIAKAKEFAKELGRAPDTWEVQMLHGIRRDLQEALTRDGYRMRVYVTFGTEWVPYFMRRLAERPANVGFVLKSLMRGR